jgi:hypothetical protein
MSVAADVIVEACIENVEARLQPTDALGQHVDAS